AAAGVQAGGAGGVGCAGIAGEGPPTGRGGRPGELPRPSARAPLFRQSKRGADDEAPPFAQRTSPPEPPITASPRSQRGLDWFAFCVADVQTGFGPFVSVYLTAQGWTQVDIGLVLPTRGLVAPPVRLPRL